MLRVPRVANRYAGNFHVEAIPKNNEICYYMQIQCESHTECREGECMGTLVFLDEYRSTRRRTEDGAAERDKDSSSDAILKIGYCALVRDALKEELALCPAVSYNPFVSLDEETKRRVGLHLDTKSLLPAPASKLRSLITTHGVEVIQPLAEQTVYRRFLRLAVIPGESGYSFLWRYCP